MNALYQCVGVSKQAVHQYEARQIKFDQQVAQLLLEADELRKEHPGCGVEKMYYTLKPDFIGRDRFVELMMQTGYRVKKRKNYRRTTVASSIYYPNLIEGQQVSAPSQIWQSDITYIPVGMRHYYAVFIVDVYTKKVVGYQVADHMRATANLQALKMALKSYPAPIIHHSDRGSQYTYHKYIDLLTSHSCQLSMCLSAPENAYAERINRTIKEEYLDYWQPNNFRQLKQYTKRAVHHYNEHRLHNHLSRMSPMVFEQYWASLPKEQRPSITIYNYETNL